MDYCLCPHKSHLHTVPHVCILSKQDSLIVRCYVIDYVLFLHKSHLHTGVILQRIHTRHLYIVHTESCPYSDYCLCPHKSHLHTRVILQRMHIRHLYTVHTSSLHTVHTESCPYSDYCVSDSDACVTVIPTQCLVCAFSATQDSLTQESLSHNCVEMTVTHECACYLMDDVSWV